MEALDRIRKLLEDRFTWLEAEKSRGRKIIGYIPGGYFPEELALAAGAVPIAMVNGGDHLPVEQSIAYVDRWIDTFYRAQIGYALSGDDPAYQLIDALVVPITDANNRALSDTLAYHSDLQLIPFGVPHTKSTAGCNYFRHGLEKVMKRIETLTAEDITEDALNAATGICNRERKLLGDLEFSRQQGNTALKAADMVMVNHASMLTDKEAFTTALETLIIELNQAPPSFKGHPRILFTGSTLAMGDTKIIDLVEKAGGNIVAEAFAEGLKPTGFTVNPENDSLEALARAYFMDRVAPAWFRPGTELPEHLIQKTADCAVDGVIWYQLLYRESYKTHSAYFPEILKQRTGLSMLTLDSDYDPAETGQMTTRIETYIESIRRQP